jgi:flagellar hook-associated protein 3 FlgL
MARVASVAQHNIIQNSIFRTQERVFMRQTQIATGKVALSFHGIPRQAQRLIGVEAQLIRAEGFMKQNGLVEARLQLMDSAVDNMFEVASQLKVRLMQKLNGATGAAGAIAAEASDMLATVSGLLNTRTNGRFLFSGSATATQPVTVPVPDPTTFGVADSTYYAGDSVQLTARVSETIEVTYGIPGNRAGFQNLIGSIKATIEADNTDNETLMKTALTMLNSALGDLPDYRNEVGASINVVSRATERQGGFQLYAEGIINDIENTDIPSAVSALAADETALQASFLTIGRLSQLTLVNFLS